MAIERERVGLVSLIQLLIAAGFGRRRHGEARTIFGGFKHQSDDPPPRPHTRTPAVSWPQYEATIVSSVLLTVLPPATLDMIGVCVSRVQTAHLEGR